MTRLEPAHPFQAIVRGVAIYGGDNMVEAMRVFEAAADLAAIEAGAEWVTYMTAPLAAGHMAPGNEDRPVVEAHAMGVPGKSFVGALYGVSHTHWRARSR